MVKRFIFGLLLFTTFATAAFGLGYYLTKPDNYIKQIFAPQQTLPEQAEIKKPLYEKGTNAPIKNEIKVDGSFVYLSGIIQKIENDSSGHTLTILTQDESGKTLNLNAEFAVQQPFIGVWILDKGIQTTTQLWQGYEPVNITKELSKDQQVIVYFNSEDLDIDPNKLMNNQRLTPINRIIFSQS